MICHGSSGRPPLGATILRDSSSWFVGRGIAACPSRMARDALSFTLQFLQALALRVARVLVLALLTLTVFWVCFLGTTVIQSLFFDEWMTSP